MVSNDNHCNHGQADTVPQVKVSCQNRKQQNEKYVTVLFLVVLPLAIAWNVIKDLG